MLHTKPIRALAACTAFGLCIAGAPAAKALTITYDVEIDALGDGGEAATLTLDIDDAFIEGFEGRTTQREIGTVTVSFAEGEQPISYPDIVIDCITGDCPEQEALTGLDLGAFALPGRPVTLTLGLFLDEAVTTPSGLLAALMSVSIAVASFDTSGDEPVFLASDTYAAGAEGLETPLPPAALLFAGGAAGLAALRKRVSAPGGIV